MTIELDNQKIEQILLGISVPPQPQIMVDLQMEQFAPEPDIHRIAELIAQDVGLSGTMLKIVNSSAYGLVNHINSVQQATILLGVTTVINIINGISIRGELSDQDIVKLNNFWDTSFDVAVVCKHVAKKIGMPLVDEAYLLGLFHNVGIVLMNRRFANYMDCLPECYSGKYSRIIDTENELFKTNHAVIGYYIARAWKLPKVICECIADHHSTTNVFSANSSASNDKKSLLAVLKIAEYICGCAKILGKSDHFTEWEQIQNLIYEYTGLGSYDLESMIDEFSEMGIVSVINNHRS
ncbi:HDOD domain-containing protein [Reinekea thalattae]|uniref:HDOD domain-containing protein n=1 Tax=Reinekea thalattae TaxID=2593301 RepID=A0A5C8ZD53_9GAMM|nr:HDOD domain-containing protein [Reinekea thalattae]TXR54846.1 HDOD domain-containing protein [Reinekea thalattae]